MPDLTNTTTELFSGQGFVQIAPKLANGQPGAFRHMGNVDALSLATTVNKIEKQEQMTGARGTLATLPTSNAVTASMDLSSWSPENIGLALRGEVETPVTAQTQLQTASPGDLIGLEFMGIVLASVVVTDLAGPTVLVIDTDYTVDENNGMIQMLPAASIAVDAQLSIAYDILPSKRVEALTASSKFFWLRFAGLNTANDNRPVLVNIFKYEADAVAALELISPEGFANFTLPGTVLLDGSRANGSKYYNYTYQDA